MTALPARDPFRAPAPATPSAEWRARHAAPSLGAGALRRHSRLVELPDGPAVATRGGLPAAALELLSDGPARLVSRFALAENLRVVRTAIAPGVEAWPAVKADAYGHGVGAVYDALAAMPAGERPEGYCVARAEEALRLRDLGCRDRVLVLAPLAGAVPLELIARGVEIVVCAPEHIAAAEEAARAAGGAWRLGVHLKIDTGMRRVGCRPEDAVELARRVHASPGLILRGVMTHFAMADEPDSDASNEATAGQIALFDSTVAYLRAWAASEASDLAARLASGDVHLHAANSGGICWHPKSHGTLVRPGLMLYGLPPGPERGAASQLTPALSLAAPVLGVADELPAWAAAQAVGSRRIDGPFLRVGLGATHGYSRRLAGLGELLVNGRRWRALAIGPQQLWAEPSSSAPLPPCDLPEPGDIAVAIGPASSGAATADDLARASGTISYEIATMLRAPVVAW